MPLVYRVENKNGLGPYRYVLGHQKAKSLQKMTEHHNLSSDHPAPYSDCRREMSKGDFCGFLSKPQLLQWFKGYLRALEKEGFFLAVYAPARLLARSKRGSRQVIFKKPNRQPRAKMKIAKADIPLKAKG
jgi:hypothetical protein